MNSLQEATVKIRELKGENRALLALLACLVKVSSPYVREELPDAFERELESARTILLNQVESEDAFVGLEAMAVSVRMLLASRW